MWVKSPSRVSPTVRFETWRQVVALGKPRLSGLVLFTAGAGMVLAPGSIGGWRSVCSLVATMLLVGAANALNSYLERDVDARMRRTTQRPLPAGHVTPGVALAVGWGVAVATLPLLAWVSNPLTALLGAIAFGVYVGIYTPLKRISTVALLVGAIPGAMPPLMGWTAVTGRVDPQGLALFLLLFAWQLPHFLAISYYLKDDYRRGGLSVFTVVHGEHATKVSILVSTLMLIGVSFLPVWHQTAGELYAISAASLGLTFLGASALGFRAASGSRWARQLFFASIVYLPLLLIALIVDARLV